VGGLQLDMGAHEVSIDGHSVEMGPTEFKMLAFFMTHPGRVYSRNQLLDHVWGGNVYIEERTIDVHIRRLRKALELGDNDEFNYSDLITTVRGAGYRFSAKAIA
jgi:two-component system phosphate regulon response regulator PhoB